MGWLAPRPEVVAAALDWIRGQRPELTRGAITKALREAGYPELEIHAALEAWEVELDARTPGADLRRRAGLILVTGFVSVWGLVSLWLVSGDSSSSQLAGLGSMILGGVLFPILAISLVVAAGSRRLRRGATGVMALVIAIPFVLLIILAGTCVASMRPLAL